MFVKSKSNNLARARVKVTNFGLAKCQATKVSCRLNMVSVSASRDIKPSLPRTEEEQTGFEHQLWNAIRMLLA